MANEKGSKLVRMKLGIACLDPQHKFFYHANKRY